MAPITNLVARAANMASSAALPMAPVYASAVILAMFSLLTVLLIIPPMCWHFRNRNLGATALVAWTIVMNLQSLINATLWPADNVSEWYNGSGLCDVEVKLQVAWAVAAPATLGCVLRALANAMDTDRATLVKSKVQRRRDYAIDLSWCIGFPLLQMLLHYIVQSRRYYLYGISGCVPAVSNSWLTILFIYIPPVIWTLIDGYFAILIITRLYRYRLTFASILASSNTTKSRFMRLYILCLVLILGFIPTQVYVLYVNLSVHRTAYSWTETHNPAEWNDIVMVPSNGTVVFDRWIWLGTAIVIFIFFGLGKEAVSMYRSGLLAVGLGRVFPSLKPDYSSNRTSLTGTISSFGSKAKLYLKRKSSVSSWYADSTTSRATSTAEPVSPKNMTFLETIDEDEKQHLAGISGTMTSKPAKHHSLVSRLTSMFKSSNATAWSSTRGMSMAEMSGQPLTVRSDVSAGHPSPTLSAQAPANSIEVIVRKEVRQGSEPAEALRTNAYDGA